MSQEPAPPAGKPPRPRGAPPPLVRAESNVDHVAYLGALKHEELGENTLAQVEGGQGENKKGRGLLRFQQLVEKERRWTRSKAANFNDLQFRGKCIEILCKKPDKRSEEDIDALLHFLFDNNFFLKFEKDQRRRIARIAKWEIFKADTIVFNQGDEGDKFYIVLNGDVSVWIEQPRDETKIEVVKTLRERAEEQYGIVEDALPGESAASGASNAGDSDGRLSDKDGGGSERRRSSVKRESTDTLKIGDDAQNERKSSARGSRQASARSRGSLSRTSGANLGVEGEPSRPGSTRSISRASDIDGNASRNGDDESDAEEEEEEEEEDPLPGFVCVAELGVGDCFGELALLKSKPRAATIKTGSATSFIVISKSDFRDTLKSHHEDSLNAKVEFLRTVPSLRHNSGPAIATLSSFFNEVTVSRNTPILEQGCDRDDVQFYLIKSGSCKVSFEGKSDAGEKRAAAQEAMANNFNRLLRLHADKDGAGYSREELQRGFQRGKTKKMRDLALLEQGQHFGAIPILNNEDVQYTVTSATVVELLVMERQNFIKHTTQTDRNIIRKSAQLQHISWMERIEAACGTKEQEAERQREEQRRKEASERLVTKYTQQVRTARAGQGKVRKAKGSSFLKLPPVIPGVQPCKSTDELIAGVKQRLPHVFPADLGDDYYHSADRGDGEVSNVQSEQVKAAAKEAARSVVELPPERRKSAKARRGEGAVGGDNGSTPFVTEVVPPIPLDATTSSIKENEGEGEGHTDTTTKGRKGRRGKDTRALSARALGLERTRRRKPAAELQQGDPGFLTSRGLQGVPHPRRTPRAPNEGYEESNAQHPAPPHTLALVPFASISLDSAQAYDPVARGDPLAMSARMPQRHYPNTQFPTRGLSSMDTTFFDPYLGSNPSRTRVAVLNAGRDHLKHRRYSRRYDTIGLNT